MGGAVNVGRAVVGCFMGPRGCFPLGVLEATEALEASDVGAGRAVAEVGRFTTAAVERVGRGDDTESSCVTDPAIGLGMAFDEAAIRFIVE